MNRAACGSPVTLSPSTSSGQALSQGDNMPLFLKRGWGDLIPQSSIGDQTEGARLPNIALNVVLGRIAALTFSGSE